MLISQYEQKRVLIWGKTYPEMSTKYLETVCTAGVTEEGRPVRLYPIPYRYLEEKAKFDKYQWITARLMRKYEDPRPESFKIDCESIQAGDTIPPTKDEWGKRADIVFRDPSWQFDSVDDLHEAQRSHKTSLGVVIPKEFLGIGIVRRPNEDAETFKRKLNDWKARAAAARAQMTLFEDTPSPEVKDLDYVDSRFSIKWLCNSPSCKSHTTQILDCEIVELHRREGEDKALKKLQSICNLSEYAIRLFLGNLLKHPMSFTVVGLWYPKRAQDRLFK
jgi:hypothetical protein